MYRFTQWQVLQRNKGTKIDRDRLVEQLQASDKKVSKQLRKQQNWQMRPLRPHDWPNDNGRALPPKKLNTSFLCDQVDFQARGLYSEMAVSSGLAPSELIVLLCVYLYSAKFCTSFKVVAAILEGE